MESRSARSLGQFSYGDVVISWHYEHPRNPPSYETPEPKPKTITFWTIALAVFVGNLLTGILAAAVLAFVKG